MGHVTPKVGDIWIFKYEGLHYEAEILKPDNDYHDETMRIKIIRSFCTRRTIGEVKDVCIPMNYPERWTFLGPRTCIWRLLEEILYET